MHHKITKFQLKQLLWGSGLVSRCKNNRRFNIYMESKDKTHIMDWLSDVEYRLNSISHPYEITKWSVEKFPEKSMRGQDVYVFRARVEFESLNID